LDEIHGEVDRETFITELKQVDADPSGLFTFGMLSQRFFFDDPTEILQDLSESILDFDDDAENEIFSGTNTSPNSQRAGQATATPTNWVQETHRSPTNASGSFWRASTSTSSMIYQVRCREQSLT
jgi:hypothetical protein